MNELIITAILAIAYVSPGIEKTVFTDYTEMRTKFGELYSSGQYKEAAEIMEKALETFPDHLEADSFNLAAVYLKLGDYEKCADALEYGLDRGIWYSAFAFMSGMWAPCRESGRFNKALERSESMRKAACQNSASEISVVTPDSMDINKRYPLFIALHGGNGNIAEFSSSWVSDTLKKEFIVLFIQSSQLSSMKGYCWTLDIEADRRDILAGYKVVSEKYNIDRDRMIIGGFSAGGSASIDITLKDLIPVKGYISLCPVRPESFTEENIKSAKERSAAGVILTTETDPRLSVQKEMETLLTEKGFRNKMIVSPEKGHIYPSDLGAMIDNAIGFIFNDGEDQ